MELVFISAYLAKVFFSELVEQSKRDLKFIVLARTGFGQAWLVGMAVGKTVELEAEYFNHIGCLQVGPSQLASTLPFAKWIFRSFFSHG
jgi:hypothetical protein